jgi:hypothetical protein
MNVDMGLIDAKEIVEYLLEKTSVYPITTGDSIVRFICLLIDVSKALDSGKIIWDRSKLVQKLPEEVVITYEGYGYKLSY